MLAALLFAAQSSLLVAPLHYGERPPAARAVAALRIADQPGRPGSALVAARELLAQVREPAQFTEAARSAATRRSVGRSGVIGVHPPGLLAPVIDAALAELEIGRMSAPIELDGGVWLVQRIEDAAACRQIFVAGVDEAARARAERLLRLARGGGDFADLARANSDDRASALRGGDFAIFERGARDASLRAAAFDARLGEIVGPIASPLGYHVLQRVGVDELDPRLRDDMWARARAILISFTGAALAPPNVARGHDAAQLLAEDLARRIRRGEDMAALARAHSDDAGLREVGGDCGWVRRGLTRMPDLFDSVFVEPPGVLLGPVSSPAGFLLLRREDSGLRSRVDLRVDAFADFERWMRALAERDETPASLEGLEAALAAVREIGAGPRGAALWAVSDELAPRCESSEDFALLAAQLPETVALEDGSEAPLRQLAATWAAALIAAEPAFREQVWPHRRPLLEQRAAQLRSEFVLLAPVALELLCDALGLADPRRVLPIYLVEQLPRAGGGQQRSSSTEASWIAVETCEGLALVEQVLIEAGRALEAASDGGSGVLSQLRAALATAGYPPSDPVARDVERAVLSAASAWTVRRVFDGAHRDRGATSGVNARLGTASETVRARWGECFGGEISATAAIEHTLEALANARR